MAWKSFDWNNASRLLCVSDGAPGVTGDHLPHSLPVGSVTHWGDVVTASKESDCLNRLPSIANMGGVANAFDYRVTLHQGQCFAGRLPVNNYTRASVCVANCLRHGR